MRFVAIAVWLLAATAFPVSSAEPKYAEIRVVDSETGRGVPLVELETVNHLKFVTDNAGRIAFNEPGLMNREIFFHVRSHGYEVRRDGFGFAGVRITPDDRKPVEIRISRTTIAERFCRLTGEGQYRDSLLLGQPIPLAASANSGRVAGQDSIQTAIYRNKVYCFWGDTNRMEYPLGLFRMAGATLPIPNPKDPKSDPAPGLNYDYFTDQKSGFARAMMPLTERPQGVIWISALCVVPDEKGIETLIGHFSRRKGLTEELEQGLARFNDPKAIFEPVKALPLSETWRKPSGHPILWVHEGEKWLLFGSPNPSVRVKANAKAVLDATQYEAFTCAQEKQPDSPDLDKNGQPNWRWQNQLPPTDSRQEQRWVREKKLKPDQTRFLPADASSLSDRIHLHSGSVRWNAHRQRWVLLACQSGGKSSFLGEVWYAEAHQPTGPFERAVKVLTHNRQSYYNVCHHDFLDREGGRSIFFEGTYTNEFSGNPDKTPRYNYNQILYRLDLDSKALQPAFVKAQPAKP